MNSRRNLSKGQTAARHKIVRQSANDDASTRRNNSPRTSPRLLLRRRIAGNARTIVFSRHYLQIRRDKSSVESLVRSDPRRLFIVGGPQLCASLLSICPTPFSTGGASLARSPPTATSSRFSLNFFLASFFFHLSPSSSLPSFFRCALVVLSLRLLSPPLPRVWLTRFRRTVFVLANGMSFSPLWTFRTRIIAK